MDRRDVQAGATARRDQHARRTDRASIIVAGGAALTQSTIEANRIATRNYADVRSRQSSSSTSATDDRIHRERIEVLRGVETYHDPVEGGTVQLDNTFDHAWRVNNKKPTS